MRRTLLDCQLEFVELADWGKQNKFNLQIMYIYMEITDRQQLKKFLLAALMATLMAELSFIWK